jgi:gliding motility-associated-like protein
MDLSTTATTSLWNNCCGYVRSLNVLPFQTYYIAIDRPHGDGGFLLNWLWTPTIPGTLPFSLPPIANRIPDYRTCSITPNVGIFNLNSVKSQINPDLINNTITFHATFANALDKVSPLSSIMGNTANPQTIYVRVTNNVSGCYSITDFKLVVLPIPTAALGISNQQICSGDTVVTTFTGSPDAKIEYTINGGIVQTAILNSSGTFTLTQSITADTTYTLLNVKVLDSAGNTICSQSINSSVMVTVKALPTATISGATTICSGNTAQISFNGTPGATVNYLDNLGNLQSIVLDSAGANSITTPILTANATYTLVDVTLLGVNPCIKTLSDAVTVTVNQLPTATISAAPTICNGSATLITFSGTPNATVSYTVNGGVNQTVIIGTSGTAFVSTGNLTATTTYQLVSVLSAGLPACSQILSGSVVVSLIPAPLVNSVVSSPSVCSGQPSGILLTSNATTATFNWTITQSGVSGASSGNGNTISQNLIATGVVPGFVTYTITANEGGCQGPVAPITITVNPIPIVTASTILQSVCSGSVSSILLTSNVSGSVFNWNVVQNNVIGASNGTGTSIAQGLTATSNNIGEAVYSVTPIFGGCPGASKIVTVRVNPIPVATANVAVSTICSSSTTNITLKSSLPGTTFSWTVIQTGIFGASPGSGATIAQTLTTVSSVQGTVIYTIIPTFNGCSGAPISVTITVNPTPEVFGSAAATICSGDSPNISLFPSIAATTFAWTVNAINVAGAQAGTGIVINDILTASPNLGTAIYTVTPTANSCSGSPLLVTITVNPAPVPQINNGVICVDQVTNSSYQNYILDTHLSNATYDFVWYDSNGVIPGATNNTYEATRAGTYSVIVINTATGCQSVVTAAVVTASFPGTTINTTETLAFSDNATITVDVSPINTIYQYSLDNGPMQSSNVFTNVSPGPHIASVTDENGCTNLTKLVTIIGYPTYFTPNGDGYHDTWNIIGLGASAKVFIYDRYGKLIKQISPTGEGWDGTYNGEPLMSSDYWFTVDYSETTTGENKTFRSHFSLKR